jgi:hypothetical protein
MRIRDPESCQPWIRGGINRIRNKHPGSATLRDFNNCWLEKLLFVKNSKQNISRDGIVSAELSSFVPKFVFFPFCEKQRPNFTGTSSLAIYLQFA